MLPKRRHVLASGIGMAALGLAGCGLSGSGSGGSDSGSDAAKGEVKGEISFQTWSLKSEKFTPYFEKLVKDFEAKHPGTKVKWMDQPGDGYQDKILSQANSQTLPDVINLPPDLAYPLVKGNFLMDLKKADPSLESTYVSGAVTSYKLTEGDGIYGFPWYLGTDMNWWNLEGLKPFGVDKNSLPTSMDEVFTLAEKIAKAGGKTPLISSMPVFTITMKDGKFDFNTDENVKLLERYAQLFQMGAMPPEVLNANFAGNSELYKQGKALWTTSTSSYADKLKTEAPTILSHTAVNPRFPFAPLFVQGLSVSGKSKNPATALAFAKFATNDENQIAFCKLAQGFLPGTVKASEDPSKFAEKSDNEVQNEAVKIASASLKDAKYITNPRWTNDMNTNLNQQMALALKGTQSAKVALDKAVEYGNKNLQK
ncbi:ABC transporter substrate-binding protein [Devriesea agamarum]|uniref:ABC transporter substrate-binding protein n=1 Tax=Devriesea agamarum TaxID=472569 RepID=UPI00071D35F0|nr:extracellular solute-binding protein [Devriesea agamarum]